MVFGFWARQIEINGLKVCVVLQNNNTKERAKTQFSLDFFVVFLESDVCWLVDDDLARHQLNKCTNDFFWFLFLKNQKSLQSWKNNNNSTIYCAVSFIIQSCFA